jgi:hypothetical protein
MQNNVRHWSHSGFHGRRAFDAVALIGVSTASPCLPGVYILARTLTLNLKLLLRWVFLRVCQDARLPDP